MNNKSLKQGPTIDVAIIGGGPSGLSAAIELKRLGISRVVVLEREPQAGGIPRHCGHPPFGLREFYRIMTGPRYAKKLVNRAKQSGVEIHALTTVIAIAAGGDMQLSCPSGNFNIQAQRVILATGVRETPRSARMISGTRPMGIINTGALQSMVYLENLKPCARPLIVGTELVSFSALMTCAHAKIKPVAMIEENARITVLRPAALYPALTGVPLHTDTKLVEILGTKRVEAAVVENTRGERRQIECDSVVLTGKFTPESSLGRSGHLVIDAASGGPQIDLFGRCSDPAYFATGNLLRPVETAGWCWNEGRQVARRVAADMRGALPVPAGSIEIIANHRAIKYIVPQIISRPQSEAPNAIAGMSKLQVRFSRKVSGVLEAKIGDRVIYQKSIRARSETRLLLPLEKISRMLASATPNNADVIEFDIR